MDITEIKWHRGTYHKFYALMKIRVGASDPRSQPIEIQEGDEFEYDGQLLKYAGAEIHSPQLRGAIKNRWVTKDQDVTGSNHVTSVQPGRNIAKAQTINRDLSRVQRGGQDPLETNSLDEETVLNVSDRRDAKSNPKASPKKIEKEHNRRSTAGMRVETGVMENQDAVVIGRVRSPTHLKVDDVTKNAGMVQAIENRALGKPELYDRDQTIEREGVKIRTNVGKVDRSVQMSQDDDGEVVGQIRHTKSASTEGVEVKDTSGIRNKPPAKASAKVVKIDMNLSPKVRMARRIDPSFPVDWVFQGKLKDRLAAVKKHGATPEFLEALYTAEGDQMRKALSEVYPNQFGE